MSDPYRTDVTSLVLVGIVVALVVIALCAK